jgi:DNA-binding transcriptional LysR family regulator
MRKKIRLSQLDGIEVSDLMRMLVVADQGSINRSALALNTTQPTLTRRIRRLETALGQDVLERSGSGVCLTEFGRHIAEHGRTIERALTAIAQLANASYADEVHLGATHVDAGLIVPRAIRAISAIHNQTQIVAKEGDRETLLSQLQGGALDILLASPGLNVKEECGLTFKPLFWIQLGVIARKQHPLANQSSQVPDLGCAKWVLFGGDPSFTQRMEMELSGQGIGVPSNAPVLPSHSAVLQFVRENDALTVLPIEILANQLSPKELVTLNGEWKLSRYPCGIYTRTTEKPNSHVMDLIDIIDRVVDDLGLSRTGL